MERKKDIKSINPISQWALISIIIITSLDFLVLLSFGIIGFFKAMGPGQEKLFYSFREIFFAGFGSLIGHFTSKK